MKRRVFSLVSLVIVATLLLSACQMQNWAVANTSSSLNTAIESHPDLSPLRLYIPKYLSDGPSQSERFPFPPPHMVIEALKSKVNADNVRGIFQVTERAPETGVFCSLRLEEIEVSGARKAWGVLSFLTWSLVPFYDDSLGYNVTYELFIDAKLRNRYQYMVRGKQLEWIAIALVVPFVSSGWQIVDLKYGSVSERLLKELVSTSRLFVEDARKDGSIR